MTSLDRWLSRLQLSPRAQRVLTEAALDWRHEVTTAPTFWAALWRHCRSALGFVRALTLVSIGSFGTVVNWTWAPRFVFWMLALVSPLFWKAWTGQMYGPQRDWGLVLSVSVRWVGWLPFVPALAVLTGPKRAASPVAGCVLVVAFLAGVNAVVAWYAYDMAFSTGVYPGYFGFLIWWYVPLGVLLSAGLTLLADRVRIDHRRSIATVSLVPQFFGFIGLISLYTRALSATGLLRPGGYGRFLLMSGVVAVPFALWFRLVRKQERRQNSPDTNLNVVCPEPR